MKRETVFSACRKYRYTLWRQWRRELPDLVRKCRDCADHDGVCPHDGYPCSSESYVNFLCLNPSVADETLDDPTIRRCIAFAKRWGYGSMCVTNIFAWRDTDPAKMKAQQNPIGEPYDSLTVVDRVRGLNVFSTWNDYWLATISDGAAVTVAAWGAHGSHLSRAAQVRKLIPNLHCLAVNNDQSPKHPLYLKKTLTPIPFV